MNNMPVNSKYSVGICKLDTEMLVTYILTYEKIGATAPDCDTNSYAHRWKYIQELQECEVVEDET